MKELEGAKGRPPSGFGTTYKAEHVLTGGPVCLKHGHYVSPESDEILLQEALATWNLGHFGVASVRDVIRLPDGRLALISRWISGSTMAKLVETDRLDAERIAWMFDMLLRTLEYVHRHGIIHGDVKPQNVMAEENGRTAVLVDFGLASIRPTRASGNKGLTDLFVPPEQADSRNPLIPETDLFSLGKTIVYALCGGDLDRVARREVPRQVPRPLKEFLGRLTATDPLNRPHWGRENLIQTISHVRQECFGRLIIDLSGTVP